MNPQGTTRNYLLKPACNAAVAAAGAAAWHPGIKVKVPGMASMPLPLLAAGATFAATALAQLINDQLFSHIPVINAWEAPAHTALNIGTITAGSAAIENWMSPSLVGKDIPLIEVGIFAAASEVAGTYLCDDLLIPMWQKWYP